MIVIEVIEKTEYLDGGDRHDYSMFSLSIDNHSLLGGRYFSDGEWVGKVKDGVEKYFPHLVDLSAIAIGNHRDNPVLAAYLHHQYNYNKGYRQGDPLCKSSFDDRYNPSDHFNYGIPVEAIAS